MSYQNQNGQFNDECLKGPEDVSKTLNNIKKDTVKIHYYNISENGEHTEINNNSDDGSESDIEIIYHDNPNDIESSDDELLYEEEEESESPLPSNNSPKMSSEYQSNIQNVKSVRRLDNDNTNEDGNTSYLSKSLKEGGESKRSRYGLHMYGDLARGSDHKVPNRRTRVGSEFQASIPAFVPRKKLDDNQL